jgi:hypothetical protein
LQTRTLDLQYPYFYLRNARDNHAPNTMWGYSQLLHSGWPYQANANEIVAQVSSGFRRAPPVRPMQRAPLRAATPRRARDRSLVSDSGARSHQWAAKPHFFCLCTCLSRTLSVTRRQSACRCVFMQRTARAWGASDVLPHIRRM